MVKKYISISFIVCLCLCTFTVASARADDEVLEVGKPAPTIEIEKYLKGEAPSLNKDVGCVLVVFFNYASVVTTLDKLYRRLNMVDLDIVAISKEKPENVEKFFAQTTNKYKDFLNSLSITLGLDESESAWRKWIEGSKKKLENGSLGFIVSRGKIVWIGSISEITFESIVRKAVLGKYDPALQKQVQPMLDAARKSVQVGNMQEAYKHFDEAIDLDPPFFSDIVLERYKTMLKNESDPAQAAEWIQKIAKKNSNVNLRNEIVTAIVKDPQIQKRDLESALIIADSMIAKSATMGLQSKAMIYAAQKDWPQAIDLQTDAWMGATIAEKPMAKQRLEEYRAASKRTPVKSP